MSGKRSRIAVKEGDALRLDWNKLRRVARSSPPVLPVAVQDSVSGEVVLLAYTTAEAFKKTLQTRSLVLWSTSRNELWDKGSTSGHRFRVVEIRVNCEQNSLLYKVQPVSKRAGGICHTRNRRGAARNCFYRKLDFRTRRLANVDP